MLALEGVGVADAGVLGCTRRAGIDGDAGDAQFPFAGIDHGRRTADRQGAKLRHGEGGAADGHLLQAIGCSHGDAAGGGFLAGRGFTAAAQAGFMHRRLAGRARIAIHRYDLRRAVGVAVDGDGEGAGRGQVTGVFDGVVEHLCQGT